MEYQAVKEFYRDDIVFNGEIHKSHIQLAEYIGKLRPESILEFGSAWGKNSVLLKQHIPNIKYKGIDISPQSIKIGKGQGVDVMLGDEDSLAGFADNSYDIVFTSSVLNHMNAEAVDKTLKQFRRIAKSKVIISECNTVVMDRWFQHDYEKLGFKYTGIKGWSYFIKGHYKIYYLSS